MGSRAYLFAMHFSSFIDSLGDRTTDDLVYNGSAVPNRLTKP